MLLRLFFYFLISLSISTPVLASVTIKPDSVQYFIEGKQPLSLDQVKSYLSSSRFTKASTLNLTFGVNSNPVWVSFQIENNTPQTVSKQVVAGVSWIDHLDLYFENSQKEESLFRAGDNIIGAPYIVPVVGIAFDLDITPGINTVFMRAKTNDPIILPIKINSLKDAEKTNNITNLLYGLLYGFLLALIASNLMFYRVLGNNIYLYYSLVIGSFVFINFGYTGQGIYWLWSGFPAFQNFSVIFMMVFYSIVILSFGCKFLNIKNTSPLLYRMIHYYQIIGIISISVFVAFQNKMMSDYIAFIYLAISAATLLSISIININKTNEGKYFFAAVAFGMIGMITTDLSVMGIIPFSDYTFHAAEVGIALEASIFALALTMQIKKRELSRIESEKLALFDPLTELHNRRSFYAIAEPLIKNNRNSDLILSVIMIDVDKFKSINDSHGHHTGDEVLKVISQRIKARLRNKDIAVRWGGEEILLFLPDTNIEIATQLAERIRQLIEKNLIKVDQLDINLTISLGVAEYKNHQNIEKLIDQADQALFEAKKTGRNKVVAS